MLKAWKDDKDREAGRKGRRGGGKGGRSTASKRPWPPARLTKLARKLQATNPNWERKRMFGELKNQTHVGRTTIYDALKLLHFPGDRKR